MKLSATVQICIWEHSEEPVTVLIFIENCRISGILRAFFAFQSVLYNSFLIIAKFRVLIFASVCFILQVIIAFTFHEKVIFANHLND